MTRYCFRESTVFRVALAGVAGVVLSGLFVPGALAQSCPDQGAWTPITVENASFESYSGSLPSRNAPPWTFVQNSFWYHSGIILIPNGTLSSWPSGNSFPNYTAPYLHGTKCYRTRPGSSVSQTFASESLAAGMVYQVTIAIGNMANYTASQGVRVEFLAGDVVLYSRAVSGENAGPDGGFNDVSVMYQIHPTDPLGGPLTVRISNYAASHDAYIDNVRVSKQSCPDGVRENPLSSPSFEGAAGYYGWTRDFPFTSGQPNGSGYTSYLPNFVPTTAWQTDGTQAGIFICQNNGNENKYSATGMKIVPGTYTLSVDARENFQSSTCWPNPCSTTDIYGTGVCRVELLANGMVFATSEPFVLPKWSTGLYVTPTVTYDVSASESYLIGAYLGVNLRVDGLSGGPWGFNVVYDNVRLNGAGGSSTGGCQGTPPLVTIGGGDTIHASACQSFVLPTATCTDPCTSDNLTNMSVYEDCAGNVTTLAGTGECVGGGSNLVMGSSYDVATPGTYIVYYDCMNAAGAVGSAQLTVIVHPDTTDPTLTCPPAVLATATAGSCEAAVSVTQIGNPVYDDACSTLGITVANNAPAGLVFPVGMTMVTWTATDAAGNTSTCAQVVTVTDTEAPTITCPSDIERINDTGQCSAVVNFSLPNGNDNCGTPTVTSSPPSGSTFNVGTTVVTVTAADVSGNTDTCSFNVIVHDAQSPTITANSLTNCVGMSVSPSIISANDNCDGPLQPSDITCTPSLPTEFAAGTTTISCTAEDNAGNTGTQTFTLTGVEVATLSVTPNPAFVTGSDIKTNYYAAAVGQTITVTATSNPPISVAENLPECWEVKTNGIPVGKLLSVQLDGAQAGTTEVIVTAGTSSKTNVIVLLPFEVVSRDKFLAGSFDIPEGWDSLEMEFVGPNDENLGKYGQLLGGGSTKIYDRVEYILNESDVASGGQSASQKVWFVKDLENERKINFYTCFNSLGQAEIKLYINGSSTSIGGITHGLTGAQDFADTIEYVDAWVKGVSFDLPDPTPPPIGLTAAPLAMAQAQNAAEEPGISNLTRAALIPFFNVINQVEGLSSVAVGLFDGVRSGIQDDWQFILLIGQAGVAAGDYAYEQALAELQKWKDDPLKRASELKQLADKICDEWVFEPMKELAEDLSTWEGFKKRAWQKWYEVQGTANIAWTITKSAWSGIVDGMTEWVDDFCARMMSGAEKAHWDSVPWAKDELLAEINSETRLGCYTFGYTFGYLVEQVAVGALTAGTVKVAQVATKGGVHLAANLAKRTAANLAVRAHTMKRLLAEAVEELPASLAAAYQRGFSLASTGPTGDGFERCAMAIVQEGADSGKVVWRDYVENIVAKTNIRKFVEQSGGIALGNNIIERQFARLMQILGDDFTEQIGRNFLKIADEVILVPKADGTVDEFFEAFFKAFEGNPSLMKHADDINVRVGGSFESMSPEAKAILKKFLSDPNAGKLWEIDVPAIVDNEPAVPHNYWVRGILAELSIFKRQYKAAGYQHFPTAAGFDFKSAAEYIQIKTLKNPDGAYGAMKKAVDDLVALPDLEPPNKRTLHILKKPGSASGQLKSALENYIDEFVPPNKKVTLVIDEFDLVP